MASKYWAAIVLVGMAVIVLGAFASNEDVANRYRISGVDDPNLNKALLVAIELNGSIKEDAGAQVVKLWKEAIERGQTVAYFKLTSTGGDVAGGMALSRVLRGDSVLNPPILIDDHCFSACAIAAILAGPKRIVLGSEATIGLHQVYDATTRKPLVGETQRIAEALRKAGVPATALKRMMRTKPSDISFLTQDELMAMNVQGRYVRKR